jgi:hypothetical protein
MDRTPSQVIAGVIDRTIDQLKGELFIEGAQPDLIESIRACQEVFQNISQPTRYCAGCQQIIIGPAPLCSDCDAELQNALGIEASRAQ